MPALVAAGDFIEDPVRDKPIENFAQRRKGGESLRPVAPRIDNLHGPRNLAQGRGATLSKTAEVLSIPDMAILGVLALLVFGEKKLPGVMRQAGRMMRDVQNTSQSFLREMDRAADVTEPIYPTVETPPVEATPAEPPAETVSRTPPERPAHE